MNCHICSRECAPEEGKLGFCGGRRCVGGRMVCDNYGRLTSIALDPIEKKPLAMYEPGSLILSVGSYGCNLSCPFCQNHEISRALPDTIPWRYVSPEQLCSLAAEYRAHGNIGVAFTYNEPLISLEYLIDTAALLHQDDLKVILVSNGSVSEAAAWEVLPHIDAMNIDLKCFTESGYERLGGSLSQTMRFLEIAAGETDANTARPHLEITTLIVPGLSDSIEDMRREAAWIASLDPSIPLHVTRYFPRYHMTEPATSVDLVHQLADTAREYLANVFVGNC